MPYLIDGHNLIGQLSGIDLSDVDDERQLVKELWSYFRAKGTRAVVYFDGGDSFSQDPRSQSGVTVRFVRRPNTADMAIRAHLVALGKEAKNWTVVSSDREVRKAVERAGARIMRSEEFARELRAGPPQEPEAEKPSQVEPDEIDRWLDLFRGGSG